MRDQLKIFPDWGKSPLSCWFYRKVKWHSNRLQTKSTKCEVTGDLHCVSLPLIFPTISWIIHMVWPAREALNITTYFMDTSLDIRFTKIFLDYLTHTSKPRHGRHITNFTLSCAGLRTVYLNAPKPISIHLLWSTTGTIRIAATDALWRCNQSLLWKQICSIIQFKIVMLFHFQNIAAIFDS